MSVWQDGLTEELATELTCPVCLEIFDDPRRLQCGHTFCHKCLTNCVRRTSDKVVCPECREDTLLQVPGSLGVSRLVADHRAGRLVQRFRPRRDPSPPAMPPAPPAACAREEPEADEDCAAGVFEYVEVRPCSEPFDGYVPFELPSSSCQDMFARWKAGLWLSPTDFVERAQLKVIRRAYVPFFVYSVDTHSSFRATVFSPQDGKTKLPTREATVSTSTTRPPAMQVVVPADASHPSRSWKRSAVGVSVTQTVRRGMSDNHEGRWGTWLWEQAAPWLSAQQAEGAKGCEAADGTDCGRRNTQSVRVDNCEAQLKLGQTFVSTSMPRERKIELNGRYSNQFSNILVCASHAVDHSLVAGLMTGANKDTDLALLMPLSSVVQQSDYSQYLRQLFAVVFRPDEEPAAARPPDRAAPRRPAAARAPRGPLAGRGSEDEIDEFLRTPGCSERSRSPPAFGRAAGAAAGGGGAQRSESPDILAFFDDADGAQAHMSDFGGSPDASPVDDRARLFAGAATVRDHFSAARSPAEPQLLGSEILVPERHSGDVWTEQIFPHVRDRELAMTREWVEQQSAKGSVVDECVTDMTVFSVEHRAVLLPCYLGTYTYDGVWYDLVIHGRTGEVHGTRPWLGSGTYENMRKGLQGHMESVKQYLEQSLPAF
eukprot:TRINITY_DN743_c5_g1_i1.p1 TRINITY_DN743_c5_g1~~TRINITY_DN743_c5_g1_i1.p1  ORF type:complete len:705 (+),score=190.16 TRINITY_DN743_c5_g1_i1:150-2117(+)